MHFRLIIMHLTTFIVLPYIGYYIAHSYEHSFIAAIFIQRIVIIFLY